MSRRATAAVLSAVLLLLGAAACSDGGDGDSLTLDEYFAELDRIGDEAERSIDAIEDPDLSGGQSFEEGRDRFADFFREVASTADDAIAQVRDLEPPDEAADAHGRYVDALDRLPAASEAYAERIDDAASEDELGELFVGDESITGVIDDIAAGCNELQDIADDNEIDVDLQCDE